MALKLALIPNKRGFGFQCRRLDRRGHRVVKQPLPVLGRMHDPQPLALAVNILFAANDWNDGDILPIPLGFFEDFLPVQLVPHDRPLLGHPPLLDAGRVDRLWQFIGPCGHQLAPVVQIRDAFFGDAVDHKILDDAHGLLPVFGFAIPVIARIPQRGKVIIQRRGQRRLGELFLVAIRRDHGRDDGPLAIRPVGLLGIGVEIHRALIQDAFNDQFLVKVLSRLVRKRLENAVKPAPTLDGTFKRP